VFDWKKQRNGGSLSRFAGSCPALVGPFKIYPQGRLPGDLSGPFQAGRRAQVTDDIVQILQNIFVQQAAENQRKGSITSRMTRSGDFCLSFFRPFSGWVAARTLKPKSLKKPYSSWLSFSSSSMINTVGFMIPSLVRQMSDF